MLISLQGLEYIHIRIQADAWFGGRAVTREAGTRFSPSCGDARDNETAREAATDFPCENLTEASIRHKPKY